MLVGYSPYSAGLEDKNNNNKKNNTSWNTVGIDLSCHWPWPNLKATNCEPNIFVSFQVASVGVYLPNQSIPLRLSHHIVSRSSFIIHSRYNIHTPSDRPTTTPRSHFKEACRHPRRKWEAVVVYHEIFIKFFTIKLLWCGLTSLTKREEDTTTDDDNDLTKDGNEDGLVHCVLLCFFFFYFFLGTFLEGNACVWI